VTDKKATDDVTTKHQKDSSVLSGSVAPAQEPAKKPAGWIKPLIEFGSLIAFFVAFRLGGIYAATITFMIAHPLSMLAAKKFLGHIAKMQWFTLVIVTVMGSLTLYLQDETFVKMKLTVINGLFATILLFGLLTGRLFLKNLMESAFVMPDEGWRLMTRNYVTFLAGMALVNEYIWRSFSTEIWVNFKTFGYMGAFIVFTIVQMPFLMKYMSLDDE
jgi:intracellular septation protein